MYFCKTIVCVRFVCLKKRKKNIVMFPLFYIYLTDKTHHRLDINECRGISKKIPRTGTKKYTHM